MKIFKNWNKILYNNKQDNNIKRRITNKLFNKLIEIDEDIILKENIEKVYNKKHHNIVIKKDKYNIVNWITQKDFIIDTNVFWNKIYKKVRFHKLDNLSFSTIIEQNKHFKLTIEVSKFRYVQKNWKYYLLWDVEYINKEKKQEYVWHIYLTSNNDKKYKGYILLFKDNNDKNSSIDITSTIFNISKTRAKVIRIKTKR